MYLELIQTVNLPFELKDDEISKNLNLTYSMIFFNFLSDLFFLSFLPFVLSNSLTKWILLFSGTSGSLNFTYLMGESLEPYLKPANLPIKSSVFSYKLFHKYLWIFCCCISYWKRPFCSHRFLLILRSKVCSICLKIVEAA